MIRNLILATFLLLTSPTFAETPHERIVSIGGSLTEILYALGAESLLVGTDTTSYFPAAAEQLPKVGYQRTLSAEGILSLQPTQVLVTEEAGPSSVLYQLQTAGVNLHMFKSPRSISDVKDNIRKIADLLGSQYNAIASLERIEQQTALLEDTLREQGGSNIRVLFILQPGNGAPMVSGTGTAADSIISLSGAHNAVREYAGYKPLNPEAMVALQPDFILTTTQGLEQLGGRHAILQIPGIAMTPAGKKQRLLHMDSLLLLGFGPRTAQAALTLNRLYSNESHH